jgi:hypothetical protein
MPRPLKSASQSQDTTANLCFEAKLRLAADKLRNNMDAAEPERSGDSQPKAARRVSEAKQYKHVVLGLIFLKYISDTFEENRAKLLVGEGDYAGANPEDPDEYKAENVFWVSADARWFHIQANAKLPTIGKTVDDAIVAIERDNPRLKGVLLKDYARPGLYKQRLGELIDFIATSGGGKTHRSVDLLGRADEYFFARFASAEGKNGGPFYTPSCVVRCLVEMLAPYSAMRGSAFSQSEASLQAVNEAKDIGRIYDPTRGAAGMFASCRRQCGMRFVRMRLASAKSSIVQSARFVENYHGNAIVPMNTSRRVLEHGRHAALTRNHCWPCISGNSLLNHKRINCRHGLLPS